MFWGRYLRAKQGTAGGLAGVPKVPSLQLFEKWRTRDLKHQMAKVQVERQFLETRETRILIRFLT